MRGWRITANSTCRRFLGRIETVLPISSTFIQIKSSLEKLKIFMAINIVMEDFKLGKPLGRLTIRMMSNRNIALLPCLQCVLTG